ncbi:hypothetical protein GWK47_049420 [Chionoecetes opilio]|uniref:Uncharacterized protein n=1 Tax=Chionoecetes opilio TaxID=41210 RepID=A0A8J5CF42_CHIOP|nr:hypothetical protein GWK47_049420 [Chionoecetes opilio]
MGFRGKERGPTALALMWIALHPGTTRRNPAGRGGGDPHPDVRRTDITKTGGAEEPPRHAEKPPPTNPLFVACEPLPPETGGDTPNRPNTWAIAPADPIREPPR